MCRDRRADDENARKSCVCVSLIWKEIRCVRHNFDPLHYRQKVWIFLNN